MKLSQSANFCCWTLHVQSGSAGERSFSAAWRLRTWLRLTIIQESFSNLTVLNSHKERTGKCALPTRQINLLILTILQLCAQCPSLWIEARMAVTLFCYKPCCFSYVNDHVHGLVSMRIPRFAHEKPGTEQTTVKWPIGKVISVYLEPTPAPPPTTPPL